jgi:formylglycine-generating enzyme required for sulfatase activity
MRNGLKNAKETATPSHLPSVAHLNRPPCRFLALGLGAWLVLASCTTQPVETAARPPPTDATPPSPTSLPPARRVWVPEGSFSAGTEPGRFDRQPDLEPRMTRAALGPFEIDAEPYPAAAGGPLIGLGRDAATERCAERGGRLCSELEWERACKGAGSDPFPSGAELDPACERARGCASGFGVWGMGSLREWTASDLTGRSERLAIVRGASATATPPQRRCAHRDAAPITPQADVGFRCCYGAPNGARVLPPRLGATFTKVSLPLAELARLLASDPATRPIAHDLHYFEDAAAIEAVLARGNADRRGSLLTSAPLAWNPVAGVELLVVAARSGESTSFVIVVDTLGDGSRRLASSFIMEDERGPVVLAYDGAIRSRVQFSTCWGCPGETGKVVYRDPDRAVISQP